MRYFGLMNRLTELFVISLIFFYIAIKKYEKKMLSTKPWSTNHSLKTMKIKNVYFYK